MPGFHKLALPLVAGAGIFFAATPAMSQEQEIVVTGTAHKIPKGYEEVKRIVKVGDLNLATDAGRNEMEKRVSRAVKAICETPKPMGNYEKRMSKQCSEMAWGSARPQMDRALRRARGL